MILNFIPAILIDESESSIDASSSCLVQPSIERWDRGVGDDPLGELKEVEKSENFQFYLLSEKSSNCPVKLPNYRAVLADIGGS